MAQKTAAMKKKKKRWVNIVSSSEVFKGEIGQSYVDDPEVLVGRKVEANLMHLTKDMKKQNMKLKFTINEIKEGKATAIPTGFELLPSFVKRAIKRNKSKVDDSLLFETKDKEKIRIKYLVITKENVSRNKRTEVRNLVKTYLESIMKNQTFTEIYKNIIGNNIQKSMRDALKAVPASNCLVRAFYIEK